GSSSTMEQLPWDPFREVPDISDRNSCNSCIKWSIKILKIVFILLLATLVLGCLTSSKVSLLFITASMNPFFKFRETHGHAYSWKNATYSTCGVPSCMTQQEKPNNNVRWIWSLHMAMCVPYVVCCLKSLWKVTFKMKAAPKGSTVLWVLLVESLHTCGLFMFAFLGLPRLDAFRGILTMCALGFVPSLLRACRPGLKTGKTERGLDILSAVIQIGGIIAWLVKRAIDYWPIAIGMVLISVVWWENFIDRYQEDIFKFKKSWFDRITIRLENHKRDIQKAHVKLNIYVSLWKLIFSTALLLAFFGTEYFPWGVGWDALFDAKNFDADDDDDLDMDYDWLILFAAQAAPGLLCKYFFTMAVRAAIQIPAITIPMVLSTPVALAVSIWACYDCSNTWQLNAEDRLFWNCFSGHEGLTDVLIYRWGVIALLFWLAELWTTRYLWYPKVERLAKTERIFTHPFYCSLTLGQSLAFNRRRNDEEFELLGNKKVKRKANDLEHRHPDDMNLDETKVNVKPPSKMNPMIYCCATMWHETEDEMVQILKSCFRLDKDQHARRMAKDVFRVKVKDYYEFEIHILFDDAFEPHLEGDTNFEVNQFVKQFCRVIQDAGLAVHNVRLASMYVPEKVETPYGGQLKYTFPGGNKMIVHLKDKLKIRHRKRWSQVMYMYYLLGEKLWARKDINSKSKQVEAENTFILALDGDVDFRPEAVRLLLDLMNRDLSVAAACGRIHPIGSGPMVWYQKFEYAIGHWLSKSTEHVLGCVLCSPGCFSLFRGSALMDDNVMKTYTRRPTEAIHYVQYDQGEDRWLCTLLLQAGYKVEYSAASDALTYCPVGFGEFFNQRRRWTPSTFANILDLLSTAGATAKKNQNISTIYMIYQISLFVSSVLGPATIFLLIVNSLTIALTIHPAGSLMIVLIPMTLFIIICLVAKPDVQIAMASVLSTLMAIVQVVVLVGIMRQVAGDGLCHPNTMLLIFMVGTFIIAALLHPQECTIIFHGFIYYLAIPTMYLLLIIYSICNLNVVSWGTREVPKTELEKENERKIEEKNQQEKIKSSNILTELGGSLGIQEAKDGIPINCGTLCRCLCCVKDGLSDEARQMKDMQVELEVIGKTLQVMTGQNRAGEVAETAFSLKSGRNDSQENSEEESGDEDAEDGDSVASSVSWIQDKDLGRGECKELHYDEEVFWKDLIAKYLFPLAADKIEQDRAAMQLKELRNKSVFSFILINVLLITLMETVSMSIESEESLGIRWNCTDPITHDIKEVELDPVAIMFILVFGIIVGIQFFCMFGHRLMTWLQIVSNTTI
ncbi:hypothetical protein CAPTEDRAFT_22210, partial [Capitella teleta]